MAAIALPTEDEISELDDQLAVDGVPIFNRSFAAAKLWADRVGSIMLALENEAWFQDQYAKLHPSVDFSAGSFLTLTTSARGVSYAAKPPMIYGSVAVQPIKHVKISEPEIGRLYHRHESAFWELQWQACDAVDLFMALVNFHPQEDRAKNMMTTAVNQLTASSRQLIASEIDASLPQGVAMAVELAGKAVLVSLGLSNVQLKAIGHDLMKLAASVADKVSSPCDPMVTAAVSRLPKYVEVRYDAPILTILQAQQMFSDALFVVADFLRRTNHDQLYWKFLESKSMPARTFCQL